MGTYLSKKKSPVLKLVETAILAALIVVLQLWGSGLKIGPVSLSFVLIPIVLGGALLGPAAGMALGFCFGAVTYFSGFFGLDPFTAILIADHPVLTALICFVKAIAAGGVAALIYKALRKKNEWLAIFLAAASAPIVNTGIFVLGALFLVGDTITGNFLSDGQTLVYFVIIGCAGINFIAEFIINLVLAPAIERILHAVRKAR